ncbi:hypothetical protein CTR2_R15540 [Comamonas thiooxydans]|uniref:hypothetical protein n=1 Tax=Comamonas TaxID=283 RepID=UPI0005584C87|nr:MULTISPECIES: hypothetical protein [Comamonas]TFF54500.1 hypothetical protein EIC84_25035 [Comamonas sp. A23]BDR08216.1 hypothetical protein CTR2_R15540 [Comamonas thiooxydans]
MKKDKISGLRRELKQMRQNYTSYPSRVLESYAKAVGRQLDSRGKEPNWVREIEPELSPPLSIPHHSAGLKAGTARSIIDQLLSDLDEWEMHHDQLEKDEADDE